MYYPADALNVIYYQLKRELSKALATRQTALHNVEDAKSCLKSAERNLADFDHVIELLQASIKRAEEMFPP